MKAAFVLGFFEESVQAALRPEFNDALDGRRILVFRHQWSGPPFDLRGFTSNFFERIQDGTDDPVVVVAQVRVKGSASADKDWVGRKLDEIVQAGRQRCPRRQIALIKERNAQSLQGAIQVLREYEFSASENVGIGGAEITELLRGGTALCVRAAHQPRYEIALARAEITCNFHDHFVEAVLAHNPNLVQTVEMAAKAHAALLYAYGGLKYLPPSFKRGFDGLFLQAETTTGVIVRFRQAVQGRQRQS